MHLSRLLIWALAMVEPTLGAGLVLLGLVIAAGVAGPWDVNGVELHGPRGWSFAAVVASLGCLGLAAGIALVRRRRWAPILAIGVWPLGALLVLLVDRLTPGPPLPAIGFLLRWAVLPGGAAAGVLMLAHVLRSKSTRA